MVRKCVRIALVGLLGAPHCGGYELRAGDRPPRCSLSPDQRKRLYVEGKPCPCKSR